MMITVGLQNWNVSTNVILGVGLGSAIFGSFIYMRRYRQQTPSKTPVARIEKIVIYPVKSLPGIPIETAETTKFGLKYGRFRDRQWTIAKDDDSYITQRQENSLALIKVEIVIEDGTIKLSAENTPDLILKPIKKIDSNSVPRRLIGFGQEVDGLDCGDEAAKWIQSYLKRSDIRFVHFLLGQQPRIHLRNRYNHPNPGNIIYQDDSQFMMLSLASVQNLNSRMEKPDHVSYRNFRPNMLLGNCESYAEDKWKLVEIGSAKFAYMEPCTRCIFTTINPETGIRNKSEPLKTLRSFRIAGEDDYRFGKGAPSIHAKKSPCFGSYFCSDKNGVISVGDEIFSITY